MPNARGKNPLLLYSTKKMYPFKKIKACFSGYRGFTFRQNTASENLLAYIISRVTLTCTLANRYVKMTSINPVNISLKQVDQSGHLQNAAFFGLN